jgi:hypothetical protein
MVAGTVIIALRFQTAAQHNFPKIRQSKLCHVISSVMFSNQMGGGGKGADRAQPSDNLGIESQKIVF